MDIKKPFLKWLGGKSQLLNIIIKNIPKKMDSYHEIFLGGGSVLLALLCLKSKGEIIIKKDVYAYDVNKYLINTYKFIQKNPLELYERIMSMVDQYKNIEYSSVYRDPKTLEEAYTSKESYYYYIRKEYNNKIKKNEESLETAALFIFLNKICFRGMYREGPNGFNVPYGHYKTTPEVVNKEDLLYISELIKDVKFEACDFERSLQNVKENDFVYLDPPYVKENINSFTGYTVDGFNMKQHIKLFNEIKNLNNIKFLLSNSCTDLVKETFKDYKIYILEARRSINSRNPESKTNEVLILNY
jgi:DNA adenine methylase